MWAQHFSSLTSTESEPAVNQVKTWCGQFFGPVYLRFCVVGYKVHFLVRAEFVCLKAGVESRHNFGAKLNFWVNDIMLYFISCD